MEWIEFAVKLAGQFIWIAIALVSLVFTFWQLWDVYGFKIRAWWYAEVKARRADLEWKQFARRIWNAPARGYSHGG